MVAIAGLTSLWPGLADGYCLIGPELPGAARQPSALSEDELRAMYGRVHDMLAMVTRVVPSSLSYLVGFIRSNFPHKRYAWGSRGPWASRTLITKHHREDDAKLAVPQPIHARARVVRA